MNLTPKQRRDIRRWNAAQDRARRAYESQPSAAARDYDGTCDVAYCGRPRHGRSLCYRHERVAKRDRGEVGAA